MVGTPRRAMPPKQSFSNPPLAATPKDGVASSSVTPVKKAQRTAGTTTLGGSNSSFGGSGSLSGVRPTSPTPGERSVGKPARPSNGDGVTVAVRVRAFTEKEKNAEIDNLGVRMKESTVEVNVPQRGKHAFTFDKCFWSNQTHDEEMPFAEQEDVFRTVGAPLVEHAISGLNSAIIAYGQTGSGKTYSIFGPKNSLGTPKEGLIPRVCNALFARANEVAMEGTSFGFYKVSVGIVEVYLDDAFDLLNNHAQLKVRGDTRQGFQLAGQHFEDVTEYGDIVRLLSAAEQRKTYGATAVHERSSRSHVLFQILLTTYTEDTVRTSYVMLADLAGSERVKVAKTDEGRQLDEACNINMSLLHLGTCIEAVVARRDNNCVEFRSSTLTKLLKDVIGGNSRTAILTTVSPSVSDAQFSVQTLRFADRAKQLQCHAHINENSVDKKGTEDLRQRFEEQSEMLRKTFEMQCLRSTLKQQQTELETKAAQLAHERQQMKATMEKMTEEQKRKFQKREAEIEAQLAALEKDLRAAEAEKGKVDESLDEMATENAAMQQEKEHLLQAVGALRLAAEEAERDHQDELFRRDADAANTLQEHKRIIVATTTERDTAVAQVRAMEAMVVEAEGTVSAFRARVISLEEELSSLTTLTAHLRGSNDTLQDQLQAEMTAAEATKKELGAARAAAEAERGRRQEAAAKWESDRMALREEMQRAAAAHSATLQSVDDAWTTRLHATDTAHAEDLRAIKGAHAEALAQQQEAHTQEMAALRARLAAEAADAAAKHRAQLRDAEERAEAAQQTLRQRQATMSNDREVLLQQCAAAQRILAQIATTPCSPMDGCSPTRKGTVHSDPCVDAPRSPCATLSPNSM